MAIAAIRLLVSVAILASMTPAAASAEPGQHEGWVEETGAQIEGITGRSYLDLSSIHRGEDGLVYFNESTGVLRPEEIGEKGFMKDAYDCAKDIKYMCIGSGDWRNDLRSTVHTAGDPALAVYRKYLCGEQLQTDTKAGNQH